MLTALLAVSILVAALWVNAQDHESSPPPAASYLRGVNVYTLEAARHNASPGDERGESQASYDYLAGRGIKLVRLAIPWSSLQPVAVGEPLAEALDGPIDERYLVFVEREVRKIGKAHMKVVLDLHNPCGYPEGPGDSAVSSEIYCGGGISVQHMNNIWSQLSRAFRNDDSVYAYDLFNEPSSAHESPATYRMYSQSVVTNLRRLGDRHLMWVEPLVHEPITETAQAGPWIVDPLHRVSYSAHFYPDYNSGAKNFGPAAAGKIGGFLASIASFAKWCTRYHALCSIGEMGWPGTDRPGGLKKLWVKYWNQIGNRAYALADEYSMDVTFFGATSYSASALWAYAAPQHAKKSGACRTSTTICSRYSQATVIEDHPSRAF